MKFNPPTVEELSDYYKSYLKFLIEDDLLMALKEQTGITLSFLTQLPENSENFRYAEGKWSIKEVVGHLSDAERILSCRALRFSRNDKTPLAPFDENAYMLNSNFNSRTMQSVIDEWQSVRNATVSLFSSLTVEMADRKGQANQVTVTPRIILYFILVHERHHLEVINERYLTAF